MKEVISKNVYGENDIFDDDIDYIVNVINDKTLRNQIQIEILAKNLKNKQKDVRLRIESVLVTTIIEENTRLNRAKKTTIHTKLLPKINNVQTETLSKSDYIKTKKQKEKKLDDKNQSYARTPSRDSGLGDSRPELNKLKEVDNIKRTQSDECFKFENITKKSKIPRIVKEPQDKCLGLLKNEEESQNDQTKSIVKERIRRFENQIKSAETVKPNLGKKCAEMNKEIIQEEKLDKVIKTNRNMLKVLNNLLRDKYRREFELKDAELDVIFSFYNTNKKGTSLEISRLERFLYAASCKRSEVSANKANIKQALVAIDSDNDKKINLDEFIHLLVLFFADKSNLQPRLESVLNNMSVFHNKIGRLSAVEASQFADFVFRFYGQLRSKEFVYAVHEEIDYMTLSSKLATNLESHLFVKWQE